MRIVGFTGAGYHYLWVLRDQLFSLHRDYFTMVICTYFIALGLQYMWFYKLSIGLYKILTKRKGKKKAA